MLRIASVSVLALLLLPGVSFSGRQALDFGGRVFDADTNRGIENLEVKLTPPRGVKASIRVAMTDRNGSFVFRQLASGKYLVEVSQGANLLYRGEVNTGTSPQLNVPLRRRR
jgi:Carboxypeptidase regulatory-like domain